MSPVVRTTPALSGTEVEVLVGFLDYHRDTLRHKTEGLDAAQLAQRLEPSTMTLGGVVKHMAYVEDWWFNQVFAGNPVPEPWASVDWEADNDWDWNSAVDDSPEELRALLDATIATSDRILADALAGPDGLDATSVLESHKRPGQRFNLRWVVAHLFEEYSRHNGHADLLRERIDGVTGD
jgi:uncharacterized damage-inducible protein DinB